MLESTSDVTLCSVTVLTLVRVFGLSRFCDEKVEEARLKKSVVFANIVTGKGNHSADEVAIKPAVDEFLRSRNYSRHWYASGGAVSVSFDPGS